MEILICFATQGPDLGCSYFPKMGYSNSSAYYTDANSNFYRSSGAWQNLLNHFRTVAAATRGYSRQYRYFEPFNEPKSILVTRELLALKKAVSSVRGRYRMQLNVPNPLYHVSGFSNPSQYLSALRSLINGQGGIPVARISFHGIFTADGVHRLAGLLRAARISPRLCEISTDGATPWRGRFTEQSHAGHQDARLAWKKSRASVHAVIDAHVEIVRAAKQEGFAVCDIQDVIKWNGDLDASDKNVRRLHSEIIRAAE